MSIYRFSTTATGTSALLGESPKGLFDGILIDPKYGSNLLFGDKKEKEYGSKLNTAAGAESGWGISLGQPSGYPFYDIIEREHAGAVFINIACAGFKQDELDVSMKNNTLTVTGEQLPQNMGPESENDWYYRQGISKKPFTKSFAISPHLKIEGAEFTDGILHITFNKVAQESTAQKIEIGQKARPPTPEFLAEEEMP